MSISRREILSLFDAYCTLLRAGTQAKEDEEWMEQVQQNGGIIVSIDGIQPDRGNETVYVVRDALTGRVLAAENVTASETAVMKAILAQVKLLDVPVLGTISDAQESLLQALEQLWPEVPHHMCQFHAFQDASRPAYEVDRKRVYGNAQAPATAAQGRASADRAQEQAGFPSRSRAVGRPQ